MDNKVGRETKLSIELTEKLVSYLRLGMPVESACSLSGLGYSTYYNWLKREEPIYLEFIETVKKAQEEAQAKLVKDIQQDPSWQSKAWILERRWPDRWSRRERIEHTGIDGSPIKTQHSLDENTIKIIEDAILRHAQSSSEE